MQSILEINGKNLCSIRDAARNTSYSRDYITRLAREGKITANHIGRQWFVDIDSLQAYAETVALEQEVRKQQLSEERKRERQLREVVEATRAREMKSAQRFEFQAVLVSLFVLCTGLSAGTITYQFLTSPSYQATQFSHRIAAVQLNTQPALVSESAEPQRSVIAQEVPATIVSASATRSVQSLGDVDTGILLLPHATTTVTELFSDAVSIETLPDGTSVVRRLDVYGQPVGNPVPYVAVSLKNATP